MQLLTRKRAGALALTLAVVGAVIAPTQAHAAPTLLDDPITLETGHIDAFNPVLEDDGSLRLALKEDVTGSHVLRTPESVELFVKPAALKTVPAGYLPGMPAEIYHLPLTQDHALIWPGWDTQAITSAYPAADTDIVVSDIEGPGQVFLWSQGNFGEPKSLLKDGTSYELPSTISQPYPAHTHANWAFTEPGTYKFTVRADVAASTGASGSSDTATYTFVVAERTALTPEAPVQSGNTVTIPEQAWMSYTDASGALLQAGSRELTADLDIRAVPALGFDLASGAASTWSFSYEPPATSTLIVEGLRHHYHQGSAIELNAVADPAEDGATYQWFVQRKDQSAPVQLAGEQGDTLRLTAEQAYDEARVSAKLIGENGVVAATAAPVVLDIDDHGAEPYQVLTIEGLRDHYHTGSIANFSAKVAPASVLDRFEWQLRLAGENDWKTAAGDHGAAYALKVLESHEGAQLRAVLTFDDGEPYVTSDPVTIEVDDHHGEEPVETELSITGLESAYAVGSVAKLAAVQQPQTDEDHYHWFVKRAGEQDYTVIPEAATSKLEYSVLAEDAGAQLIVRLYDHDHGVIAESKPVTLNVLPSTGPGDQKPGRAPAEQDERTLEGVAAGGIELDREDVKQGGTVTIALDGGSAHAGQWVAAWMFSTPVLLGGDWQQLDANGALTVRVPADASPGAHRIAVFDTAGALVGWQSIAVAAADTGDGGGTGSTGSGSTGNGTQGLERTGAEAPMLAAGASALLLLGGLAALAIARRRSSAARR